MVVSLLVLMLFCLNTTAYAVESDDNLTYQGFNVLGKMEIPKINFSYPVLEKVTTKSLDISVAFLYGVGLNKEGNSVIVGRNLHDGTLFSNIDELSTGDVIYVTDNGNQKIEYEVYRTFETTSEDTTFYKRDTNGAKEITLSTI